MATFDYVRYLEAKQTVDDRALDKECMEQFRCTLRRVPKGSTIRIIELGAGTGTMLRRFVSRFDDFFGNPIEYTMVDIKGDALTVARRLLLDPTKKLITIQGNDASISAHHSALHGDIPDLQLPGLHVRFVCANAYDFLDDNVDKLDAVVAASFLDLVSLDGIMYRIKKALNPASQARSFYFPLTFNGVTEFSTARNDSPILKAFHSSMGDGYAGGKNMRRAFTGSFVEAAVKQFDGKVVMTKDSIWNVTPERNMYEHDEAYFLRCILQFVGSTSEKELSRHGVSSDDMEKFMSSSMSSLDEKTLSYKAHNVDIVGTFPSC